MLQQLESNKEIPDLILMDIKMKELDGIETTKVIKKKYPDIAIIGLSNYSHDYVITSMILAGAKGFLTKNIESDTFINAINTVLDGDFYIQDSLSYQLKKK